jgi:hypothetical protein
MHLKKEGLVHGTALRKGIEHELVAVSEVLNLKERARVS